MKHRNVFDKMILEILESCRTLRDTIYCMFHSLFLRGYVYYFKEGNLKVDSLSFNPTIGNCTSVMEIQSSCRRSKDMFVYNLYMSSKQMNQRFERSQLHELSLIFGSHFSALHRGMDCLENYALFAQNPPPFMH